MAKEKKTKTKESTAEVKEKTKKTEAKTKVKETKKEEVNVSVKEQVSETVDNKKEKKKKHKRYYSYGQRLFGRILMFLILFSSGIFLLMKSFELEEEKTIKYSEFSNLDYKVYLKENDFYEQDYIGKDMIYIANLIDKIKVDFNYNFNIENKVDLKFDYQVVAKLQIMDSEEKYTYYEKKYSLLNNKQVELKNDISKNIFESIQIDYDKYNKIANDFKNTYGVGTTSKLVVYFNIDKTSLDSNYDVINGINNIVLSIPLSEKSINIDMNYKDINNKSYLTDHSKIIIDNIVNLVVSILLLVLSIAYVVKVVRLLEKLHVKKNVYDVYIKKILTEYDRLIVETTTPPMLEGESKANVIFIKKFTELLDVRDNLKQPIMYYTVTKHEKCHFYIINNDKIYLNTIKKIDLEGLDEK